LILQPDGVSLKHQTRNRMSTIYKYDIALSFAGEDRPYVDQVAHLLREKGIVVFYDNFEEENLLGKNLYDYLSDLYANQALFTVMFISKFYAQKLWTDLERQAMQSRAFRERQEYILPIRFDDTKIPGLLDIIAYVSANNYTPERLADLLEKKLKMQKNGLL
jgi:hypothetical protein